MSPFRLMMMLLFCVQVGAMFKEHSSDKSTKLTVLVATKKTWADPKHIQEAAALKGGKK